MTPAQIKNQIKFSQAIISLETEKKATWSYMIQGEDLSRITFVKDDGNGYSIPADKPSDFPSDEQINARLVAMHNLADAGKSLLEITTNTSW